MPTMDETERLLPSTSTSVGKPRASYHSVIFVSKPIKKNIFLICKKNVK